jgi:hypothetical protein
MFFTQSCRHRDPCLLLPLSSSRLYVVLEDDYHRAPSLQPAAKSLSLPLPFIAAFRQRSTCLWKLSLRVTTFFDAAQPETSHRKVLLGLASCLCTVRLCRSRSARRPKATGQWVHEKRRLCLRLMCVLRARCKHSTVGERGV